MASPSSKVADRITAGLKRYQPVLTSAKARDVGESDTVTIVVDMLADLFGYDKYSEISSEHAIRGTYCDLAITLDGSLQSLIEVKAIGLELKEAHVKQAVDYAANQGVDWVVLTNGVIWRFYKVTFTKPIDHDLVLEIDICSLNSKIEKDTATLFLFCKEGWSKSVLSDYFSQRQALSRFFLGALVLTEPVLSTIRRELRRISPDVKIGTEEIKTVLISEVFKRDVMEGEKAEEARRRVTRFVRKTMKAEKQALQPGTPCDIEGGDLPPGTLAT